MYFVLTVALLILSFGECAGDTDGTRTVNSYITVRNGQSWGTWGRPVLCPPGTYATGFSIKVHSPQGAWRDDTALNGIKLYCTKPMGPSSRTETSDPITSDVGSHGSWTRDLWCSRGVLRAFQLRVQSYQVLLDDSAANNIRFLCTDNQVLEGPGSIWGSWGSWSNGCHGVGICGIQTQVDDYNAMDVTALNDVDFACCNN